MARVVSANFLAALCGVAISFLAGCLGTGPDPESTLTFRTELGVLNLDPLSMVDTESRKVATLLHAGLVAIDLDGTATPRLATSWERVSDNTWRFEIRKDILFSDGQAVNSNGVVRSLCAAMQPGSPWAWSLSSISQEAKSDADGIACTGLKAVDDHVLEITEAVPTSWLLEALAGPGGWIVDMDGELGEHGVRPGIGPYVLDSLRVGSEAIFTARTDGGSVVPPLADRIVFRFLPDHVTAASSFAAGEIDMLRIGSPLAYEVLVSADSPGERSLQVPGRLRTHPFSRMRLVLVGEESLARKGLSPEEIVLFRRALSASVDRGGLADRAPGMAMPWFRPFPPAGAGSIEAAEASAGTTADRPFEGVSLTLLVNNDPYSDSVASYLPTDVGGAAITYRAVDFSVILSEMQERTYDLVGLSIDATIDVPAFWGAFFIPGAPFLLFGKALPQLEQVNLETDAGLAEAARIVDESGNWISLYREEGMIAIGPRLEGLRLTPSGQVSLETVGVRR